MMGFQPPTCDRPRRATRQQFPVWNYSIPRSGTPSGGLSPAGVRGYGSPPSNSEALAHPALILGDLERGRFTGGSRLPGATTASVPSFGSLPGRSVRGLPTESRTDRHVWPISTMRYEQPMTQKFNGNQSSNRAIHTEAHVGFLPRLKARVSALRFL